jgi:hypothetical protein
MSALRSFAFSFLAVVCPLGLEAQSLDHAEQLAFAGRAEEARSELEGWWEASWEEANRLDRQRGLRLRALLTVDPEMAELDYQRLVIEFPGGPYSDEALMRLGSAAAARGAFDEATSRFQGLLRDYPDSDYRSVAEAWLAANAPAEAEAEVEREPEPQRPGVEPDTPAPRELAAVNEGDWTVQVGAFSSQDRARTLNGTLQTSGFASRVVLLEGSGLHRVRVGRYTSEAEANAQRQRLVEAGFEARVVSNAARERVSG